MQINLFSWAFLLANAACLFAVQAYEGAAPAAELRANSPLQRQVARLDGSPERFMLAGLRSHTSYEIRVSYPATTPATIHLRLVGAQPAVRLRRLLDTEKLIFRTDAFGQIQGLRDAEVELRAVGRFVHRDGPGAGPTVLVYNIVCQELLLHSLPSDCLPVIAVCLLLVGAAWIFAPFFSRVLVPYLLHWVLYGNCSGNNSGSSSGRSSGA